MAVTNRAHHVEFRANPTQKLFIESRALADLFSSRMGEGKSAGIVWACFHHTWFNPGATWAIIRDTWENLQATTMKEFFKWFPPGVAGNYISSRKTFVWGIEHMAGSEVQFLGMDDPADAGKLQSRELAGFAIDEPSPAEGSGGVSEEIFTIAMSRLRQPGMKWYAAKLAQNNPDETHWTYRLFVEPGTEGYVSWQTHIPENLQNLPGNYYEYLRKVFSHRPDLQKRFVDGQYGFQQQGKAVTPEWNDRVHLAVGLTAIKGVPLTLLWDFGLNPTCIITQVTPMGHWLILDAMVSDGDMGVEELIDTAVKPTLATKYRNFRWQHIGDPMGKMREQSSATRTAVRAIRKIIGGPWRDGVVKFEPRREALRAALNHLRNGVGMILVDRQNAKAVWHALRGGWKFHVTRTGIQSKEPVKDIHSHPGDAMSYGASVLFPLGKLKMPTDPKKDNLKPQTALAFGKPLPGQLGFERPGQKLPKEGAKP